MIPEICKTQEQLIDLCNESPEWIPWMVKQVNNNPKNPNLNLYRKVLRRMALDTLQLVGRS